MKKEICIHCGQEYEPPFEGPILAGWSLSEMKQVVADKWGENLIYCDGTSSPVDFSKPICDWSNSDNPWAKEAD